MEGEDVGWYVGSTERVGDSVVGVRVGGEVGFEVITGDPDGLWVGCWHVKQELDQG